MGLYVLRDYSDSTMGKEDLGVLMHRIRSFGDQATVIDFFIEKVNECLSCGCGISGLSTFPLLGGGALA